MLYDEKGYEVKIEISPTYNPCAAGVSDDKRDLGVNLRYIGADKPEHIAVLYEKDKYVVSRIEYPYSDEWNYQAANGGYPPEGEGSWMGPVNTIYLKDSGIYNSGLRFTYCVPGHLIPLNSVMKIYINNEQVKEIQLTKEGIYTEYIDVRQCGKKEEEYLDRAHRILKILLSDFDRVCKKYKLHYYLICGSLLGAVRHGDLIPWDDDVDIAMPRKDFDILLNHAAEEWGDGKDILFLNYDQMGKGTFLDFMTRIVYMKEEIPVNVFRKIEGKGRKDIQNHMPLDIYVLDNASDNESFHKFQTNVITGLYGLAMGHRAYINPDDYKNRDVKTQRVVKAISSIGKIIPLSWIIGWYEWVRKWNKNKKCENYFESNGFIYCVPWKFKQEWFGKGRTIKLGDMEISAPQDVQAFLKMHYSDYTQYPPIPARMPTHSIEASGIF